MGSRWALPHLLLYYELVRLPYRHTSSFASSARWKLPGERYGSPKFRCKQFGYLPWSQTPARRWHTHRLTHAAMLTSGTTNPSPNAMKSFRGSIPSLALWSITCLSSGSAQFVTSLCSEFSSGLVVSLWPGWIVQLVCTSLAWHTVVRSPPS